MSAAVIERDSLVEKATPAVGQALAIWALTAAFGLTLVGLILSAPLAQAYGHPSVAASIYRVFSFVCHQIPERSFHLAGHQFGVCSRCTGLYTGFAVAALAYPLIRSLKTTESPPRLWLILSAVPLIVDFSLGYFGIWQNNHLSRFTTGALLGSVAVFYIMPGLIELSSNVRGRLLRRRSQAATHADAVN
jgi:uncharacterized membrane protein